MLVAALDILFNYASVRLKASLVSRAAERTKRFSRGLATELPEKMLARH